jgi:tape measure domain-containing protein
MPAVEADAVLVAVTAKVAEYDRQWQRIEDRTRKGMEELKRLTKVGVGPQGAGSGRSSGAASQAEKDAQKVAAVTAREAAKTAAVKERIAAREAANQERANQRKIVADQKAAQKEIAAAERAAASAERAAQRKAIAEEKAAARATAANEKAAARQAEIAARAQAKADEAARRAQATQDRLAAVAERAAQRQANIVASGNRGGGSAGSRSLAAQQTSIMGGSALGGRGSMPAPTAPQDKINYLLRDRIDLEARLSAASASGNRQEQTALRDQLTQLRLIERYRRAGVDEIEAAARAEQRVADIQRRRAAREQAPAAANRPLTLGGVASGIRTAATLGIAGYGAAQGAREYAELTDAYKSYNAQLRLATTENGNLATAQADVQRIATETRSGLSETAQLYATFQRNADQLGITQQQSARATETVTKSFQISGATAAEAAGGLRQFLQGLQSGTLRGEEFNSVVENAPRLAKLLADQLAGGNIGALRALAEQGKITGDQLIEALTNRDFTAKLDEEFKQLPVTFDQASTLIYNSAVEVFGAFDEGGQFSEAIVNFVTGGKAGFSDLAGSAEQLGIDIRATFAGLSDAFAPLGSGAAAVFSAIGVDSRSLSEQIRGDLSGILRLAQNVANAPLTASNPTRARFADRFDTGSRLSQARGRQDSAVRRLEALGFYVPRNSDGTVNEGGIVRRGSARAAVPPRQVTAPAALGRARAIGGGRGSGNAERQAERAAQIATRNADRYNDDIRRLDDQIIDAKGREAETAQQRADAALASIQRDQEARTVDNERARRDREITDAQYQELQARSAMLAGVQRMNVELQRREAAQRENDEKASALLRVRQDELEIAADLATNERDRLAAQLQSIDLERDYKIALLRRAELQAAINGNLEEQERIQAEIANEVGRARARSTGAREDARGSYQRYRDRLDPDTAEGARSLSEDIDSIKIQTLETVTDELTNATMAALGLKGAFGDIVGELIKIGIQRKLIGPLADRLFGAADGASGGGIFGNLLGSLFGGARASGGDVTAGRLYQVNEGAGARTEIFQPAQSGKIIPLGRASIPQQATTVIRPQINVDARGAVMNDEFARQILARADRTAQAYATRAGQAAYNNSPARLRKVEQLGN